MKWLLLPFATLSSLAFGVQAMAGDLVYQPRNPSFGGNPLYSSHLLGVATAINKFEDPKSSLNTLKPTDPSAEFQRMIQSSLLSRISSEVANQIYGENAIDAGKFVIGTTAVDFHKEGGQTVVNLTDQGSGGTTRIEIPTPKY